MLPEYPKLSAEFGHATTRAMQQRAREIEGIVATVPSHRVFEGDTMEIIRSDGSTGITKFREETAELRIPVEESPDLELSDLMARLDQIVFDLAAKKAKNFFQTLSDAASDAGTRVDAKGQKISAEIYLQMLDRVWIEFEPDGTPRLPTLVVSPQQQADAEAVRVELFQNPALRKRFDEIILRKLELWRAREADRELA
jgi:hypothetical protein